MGVSLRMGDMALVHVTTFKSWHKIHSRWENREYVLKWQPYPNLPIYAVQPIDREGHSCTICQNFLLPIIHSLEQDESKIAVEGAGSNKHTPVPHKAEALPANNLTKSQLESTHCSPSKQCELVNPEPTGSTSPESMDEGLQANDDDAPAPLRWSSRKMRNQLPLRYQNAAAWQHDILPSTLDLLVGLCICLHILSCLYTVFMRSIVWKHSTWTMIGLPDTNDLWHGWGYHWYWLYSRFCMEGVDQRIFGLSTTALLRKPKDNSLRDSVTLWAVEPQKQSTWWNNEVALKKKHLVHGISGGNSTMIY